MTKQYLLDGTTQTIIDPQADDLSNVRGLFGAATVYESGQERTYQENLAWWTELTVAWIWHNDKLRSPRSQARYLAVWLDCFGTHGKFEYMPVSNDIERAARISSIINAAPRKPWEFDGRAATSFKITLENRTHITGKAQRVGKKGTVLQKDTRHEVPMSPKSVSNAVAVMSSYFKKAARYPIYKDGVEVPLFNRTVPFDAVERPRFETMFVREGFTAAQINKILSVIPIDTVRGSMHYALILAYALTGRRNSEIRTAKFGDFRVDGDGKVWQTWRGKHHVEGVTDQVHPDVWAAIELYLKMAGRLDTITADDYIFTALTNNVKHSRLIGAGWQPGRDPLSIGEVWRIVQVYLKKAKIKGHYTVHSFRHGLAEQMMDLGARDSEIQRQLGHANPATTMIYHAKKKQEMSQSIDRVGDNIGSARLLSNRQQFA